MMDDKKLERVKNAIMSGNCGRAIQEMEVFLQAWPEPQTQQRLNDLKEDYGKLVDYWMTGGKDPQRDAIYQQLLQLIYVLYANVEHYHRLKASPYLYSLYTKVRKERQDWKLTSIRQELEGFVSDVALLELEPEQRRRQRSETVYKEHQKLMNLLFEYVLTSRQWTTNTGQQFLEMLTAPTIDSMDQQLLVSAITLSLLNQFDMAKMNVLMEVYRLSQDEAVRQRALIGWVLTMDERMETIYPEQGVKVRLLVASKETCRELTELQIQLMFCLNAEKDTSTIHDEILPELMKGNNMKLTKLGLMELEDDPMEDILTPGASEQRLERMAASYDRMMEMMKQGSDIFFGGFAQMKRYPFFYDISNWLVPFYIEHPDIQQSVNRIKENRFIQHVMSTNQFCNSDRYSFIIAFDQVMNQLPESMQQMLKRGEAGLDEAEDGNGENGTALKEQRAYLMDMYRFFRLFPHRAEMSSPFDMSDPQHTRWQFFSRDVFKGTPLEACKHDVVRMMRKYHYKEMAQQVLDTFPEDMRDMEYYMWQEDYYKAIDLEPDNEQALAGVARLQFGEGWYDSAASTYDRLMQLYPAKRRYMLNRAICLVNLGEYEEALKLLFQLNYEEPNNVNVTRALAWALTCSGKLERAEKLYDELFEREEGTAEDYHNYGCCLWLQGRVKLAAQAFRTYAMKGELDDAPLFTREEAWLKERGITETDIKLMEAERL